MKNINEAFSPEESKEIYDKFITIVSTRRDNLVKKYGKEAERVAYASAVNQVKKKATQEPTIEEPMDQDQKLKEMIQAALSKPLSEKKKSFPDLTGDGKVTQADILKGRGVIDEYESEEELIADEPISEDLDLGHTDDEPGMLKADLYRIGKYAMELYKMVDQFEGPQEVDFPHWWQSKIVKAKEMLVSAKHYLDFETKEPEIDAAVDVIDMSGTLDNVGVEEPSLAEKIAKRIKEDVVKGSNVKKVGDDYRVLSGKTGKMWPQKYKTKKDAEDAIQAYHANKAK